uniref:Uncharacterized protein n=1 Tax=Cacopsylla melanoneura TaxID=428564 RepID=A0A8D9E360_9HEMI
MSKTDLTLESIAQLVKNAVVTAVQNFQKTVESDNHELISQMKKNIELIKIDVINTINESTRKLIKQEVVLLKDTVGKIVAKVETICKDNTEKIEDYSKDIRHLIKKEKKKNIILYNFPVKNNWKERETAVLSLLQDTLETSCTLKDIDFIDNLRKTENSPIRVGLTSWRMKMEILKNRVKLWNTKISMDEDYTREAVQKRKELKIIMKSLKEKGLQNVQLKHTTLYVNGKPWNQGTKECNVK